VRRYFFHLKSADGLELDEIGLDLADEKAAYRAAVGVMAELVGELIRQGRSPLNCSFWITNDRDDELIEAPFRALLERANELAPPARAARPAKTPNFRSARAGNALADGVFRQRFEASAAAHLLLTPDLTIAAANERYRLVMERSDPDELVGRDLFEAFPEHADAPSVPDRRSVTEWFQTTLTLGVPQVLSVVRYDIRGPDGRWRERYWSTQARPILDEDGSTIALDVETVELTREMNDLAVWRRRRLRRPGGGEPSQ
jgi:PAS domain-containing protein